MRAQDNSETQESTEQDPVIRQEVLWPPGLAETSGGWYQGGTLSSMARRSDEAEH